MSVPSEQLPNPYTPMAFFPPELATQLTISVYVIVGSLSALIWDIIINLHSDWKMLRNSRTGVTIVVYFISRFSTLAYVLGVAIVQTQPIGNCGQVYHGLQFLFPIAIPATSLLFFFRVRAMYTGNNWVIGFFFVMWLAVLGASSTLIPGSADSEIGPTSYCFFSNIESYVAAACFVAAINDTLVFCACTWRLMKNSYAEPNLKNEVNTMIFGRHLPAFSRSLLQDGQAYYLTTVAIYLVTSGLYFAQAIPAPYRHLSGYPNIVLVNNMACHVYRKVRFGVYREFSGGSLDVISAAPSSDITFN